jgi:hypothetical protein
MALGVARVHAVEIEREERGLFPALAGTDLDDDVLLVEWIARDELRAKLRKHLVELTGRRREVLARDVAQIGVVRVDEQPSFLEAPLRVAQRADRVDDRRQLRELLSDLADALVAAGHLRVGHEAVELVVARLDLGQAAAQPRSEWVAHG